MSAEANAALEGIRSLMGECRRCGLAETRSNIVFGEGDTAARIMLIGEAPGSTEDQTGVPFVGGAGALLDELLGEAGIGRDAIYVTNVVKCRPPGNRNPMPAEIEACAPFLSMQIEALAPAVIITAGNFATRFILQTREGITRLRGVVHPHGDSLVVPVFHPAAVMRDPRKRSALLEDLQLVARVAAGVDFDHRVVDSR